jgi:SSS family solute:Na+ symporter
VVVIALSIASFTYGGLLGAFFLAMLWPRAIQRDAILAMAVGIGSMSIVVFAARLSAAFPALAGPLAPFTGIAWPWFVLIGTAITLSSGILSSFTHAAPASAPHS